MKCKISFFIAGAAVIAVGAPGVLCYADSSALMTSAQATSSQAADGTSSPGDSNSSSGTGGSSSGARGVSRAALLSDVVGDSVPVHVSDFSMLMGPSINNFSSNAPSASAPFSGFSVRHDLRIDYSVNDRITVGPSFDVNENLYSSSQGSLVFNDPSMLLAIADVNRARWGSASLRGSVWLQAYAPLSKFSKEMHEYTAFSAAYIPVVHFRASRFFLSGVGSAKANFMENQAQTGVLAPVQWVAAAQGNYRLSPQITVFLMDHVNTSCGPKMSLPAQDIAPDMFKRKAKMAMMQSSLVTDGIMAGAQFQLTRSVGISPRMDWQVNQPLNTTSVGLNASFHLI